MKMPENKQTPSPHPGKYSGGGFGGARPKGAKDDKAKKAADAKEATDALQKEQAKESDGGE